VWSFLKKHIFCECLKSFALQRAYHLLGIKLFPFFHFCSIYVVVPSINNVLLICIRDITDCMFVVSVDDTLLSAGSAKTTNSASRNDGKLESTSAGSLRLDNGGAYIVDIEH